MKARIGEEKQRLCKVKSLYVNSGSVKHPKEKKQRLYKVKRLYVNSESVKHREDLSVKAHTVEKKIPTV